MSDNNYHGRRAGGDPVEGESNYVGKRAQEETFNMEDEPVIAPQGKGELFHDPFKEHPHESIEGLENEGEAFNVKRGRHEALIEGVFSTEIDGGDMSTLATKKKVNPLLFVGLALALVIAAFIGYSLLGSSDDTNTTVPTNEKLIGALPQKYPGLEGVDKYTTVDIADGAFVSSSGSSLSGRNMTPIPPDKPCTLKGNTDFCFAGTFPLDSGGRVFYTNDLVNSDNFTELYEYTEAQYKDQRKKTVTVANVVTDFLGAPTRFLLYVDSTNADGWFMEIPMESAPGTEQELLNTFTYTP